mgnify:CR=1 FL=1
MSIDKRGNPWCDYCGGAIGVGVYILKLEETKHLEFCEKECRENYKIRYFLEHEAPDIVY